MFEDASTRGNLVNDAAHQAFDLLSAILEDEHLVSVAIVVMVSHQILERGNVVNLTCTTISSNERAM